MDPMEEQNHFVNDSEMGNPSILSALIYFAIHISMYIYFALYVFMIEWRINKQKQTKQFIIHDFHTRQCFHLYPRLNTLR